MADSVKKKPGNNTEGSAPDLKVVKPDDNPGADLLALGVAAMAKAKEEIRAEVKKEIIGSALLTGIALYFILRRR